MKNLNRVLNAKREIVERLSIRNLLDAVKMTIVYNEANDNHEINMMVSEKEFDCHSGRNEVMKYVTYVLSDLMNSGVISMYSNVQGIQKMLYDYTVTVGGK